MNRSLLICLFTVVFSACLNQTLTAEGVDRSAVDPDSAIKLSATDTQVQISWPIATGEQGSLVLRTDGEGPLIESLSLAAGNALADGNGRAVLLQNVDPVFFLTVGSRQGNRAGQWMVFFDRVHLRPYKTYQAKLSPRQVRLRSSGSRATVEIDQITAGPFRGSLELTVYAGSPLIRVEAVMSTEDDGLALLYDAGLVGDDTSWKKVAWLNSENELQVSATTSIQRDPPLAVKHRTVIASSDRGSVALFPSPHQFFCPLDNSTNLQYNWVGRGYHDEKRFGIGIRQHPEGDNRFVPWFNAPPKTKQRLSFFLLASRQDSPGTLEKVLRYTHGDHFKRLPGHRTLTSHYHVAHTMDVMRRRSEGKPTDDVPEFVNAFRNMGIDIVHLAEFHGDGNPRDKGNRRLEQLDLMHRECERLSDDNFLLLPGEEPNVHLGGHWMSFFPRPVYWIMSRDPDQPFVEKHPKYGHVYRIGNADELWQMLRREQGLAWTAHARIKSSTGFPDKHRHEPFFLSDRFFGAAWKAMPADLSRDKTGERVLDLLSDMANWTAASGTQQSVKYALGEVDVFKIDHTHELYGHMNINYLRLDDQPRFGDGWQSVLDALSGGRFFVSTGEVLIPKFTVGGKASGEKLRLDPKQTPMLIANIEGTFPLSFAEVISGDGKEIYRQRIDLSDSPEFDSRTLRLTPDLRGRRWVRLEVWDIAANGAFTQPIWIQ